MEANYPGTELCPALEYTFENKTKQQVDGKPIPVAVFVLTDGETGDISGCCKGRKGEWSSPCVCLGHRGRHIHLRVRKIARAGKVIAVYVGVSGPLVRSVELSDN